MNLENDKPRWFALEITVEPDAAEAIEFALNSLDSLGTEINHLRKPMAEPVKVVGYFNEPPDGATVREEIRHALVAYGFEETAVDAVELREVADQDWLSEWKKHWKPTEVSRFIISPPWERPDGTGRIVIYIEPNMAFGTGTHETTQLCLAAIGENYIAGESLLDVGTGTGILSIAGAKLNTERNISTAEIYACDIDSDSVLIAIENAKLNGVEQIIDFHLGPVSGQTPIFDFACANLTLDTILPNLEMLRSKARRMLVLSGILANQETEIAAALDGVGLRERRIERSGEWISVTIAMPSGAN